MMHEQYMSRLALIHIEYHLKAKEICKMSRMWLISLEFNTCALKNGCDALIILEPLCKMHISLEAVYVFWEQRKQN